MTYGRPPGDGTPSPGDDILTLEAEIESRHPGWVVIVPGETPTCTLNATTNVQGRFLNGVAPASVCGTNASGYSGRFLHIEQKIDMRGAQDWIDAIDATWPVPTCAVDADCDDGVWCNGAETCVAGACQPGTDPCAGGACDEAGQVCTSVCGDAVCDAGEDCNGCGADCPSFPLPAAVCGNGLCEAGDGEDCVTCAADCNGQQGGKPSGRFCCGDGGGTNPLPCSDATCSTGGWSCTDTPSVPGSFCCGDLACDSGESCSSCALDCTLGVELCTGGVDEDCDGDVDCDDLDCLGPPPDPACEAVDCSTITDKQVCNAEPTCRWDNRNKVCVPS